MSDDFERWIIAEIEAAGDSIEPAETLERILGRIKDKETVHQYGSVRGPVSADLARTGTFIKSFGLKEFQEMLIWCDQTRAAMARNQITGDLVFTRRTFMWYVYLITETA
jgi:hypothetical protein